MPGKVFFGHASVSVISMIYAIFSIWRHGNCLVLGGGVKIARDCDIYFWGVTTGFSAFGKMPPNTLFCRIYSLFLAPPTLGVGGIAGASGCL